MDGDRPKTEGIGGSPSQNPSKRSDKPKIKSVAFIPKNAPLVKTSVRAEKSPALKSNVSAPIAKIVVSSSHSRLPRRASPARSLSYSPPGSRDATPPGWKKQHDAGDARYQGDWRKEYPKNPSSISLERTRPRYRSSPHRDLDKGSPGRRKSPVDGRRYQSDLRDRHPHKSMYGEGRASSRSRYYHHERRTSPPHHHHHHHHPSHEREGGSRTLGDSGRSWKASERGSSERKSRGSSWTFTRDSRRMPPSPDWTYSPDQDPRDRRRPVARGSSGPERSRYYDSHGKKHRVSSSPVGYEGTTKRRRVSLSPREEDASGGGERDADGMGLYWDPPKLKAPPSPDIGPSFQALCRAHGVGDILGPTAEKASVEELMEKALISVAFNKHQHDWDGQEAEIAALFPAFSAHSNGLEKEPLIPFMDPSRFGHRVPPESEPHETFHLLWEEKGEDVHARGRSDPRSAYASEYDKATEYYQSHFHLSLPAFATCQKASSAEQGEVHLRETASQSSDVSWAESPRGHVSRVEDGAQSLGGGGGTGKQATHPSLAPGGHTEGAHPPPAPKHEAQYTGGASMSTLIKMDDRQEARGVPLPTEEYSADGVFEDGETVGAHPTLEEGHFQARNFDGSWREPQEQLAKLQKYAKEGVIPNWPVYRRQDALWVPMEAEALDELVWRGTEVVSSKLASEVLEGDGDDAEAKAEGGTTLLYEKNWKEGLKKDASEFCRSGVGRRAQDFVLEIRLNDEERVKSAEVEASVDAMKKWKKRISKEAEAWARRKREKGSIARRIWGGPPPVHVRAALKGELLGPMSWEPFHKHPLCRVAEELLHNAIRKKIGKR